MPSCNDIPPNCQIALDYADSIAFGEIPACREVQQGIKRFFRDMKRSTQGGPFVLDYDLAERAMVFAQMLPHIKGPEAGNNLSLAPWQKFIYLNVFGWTARGTKNRRFRKVYTEVPRGNGKSTMVAPVGLYMLAADRESGAEIYSAAVSRDQARIVFDVAKAMGQRRAKFLEKAGVGVHAHAISQDSTNSSFKALSSDASSLDGLNVHLAILDELARHKTREVHDVIETATGKRLQPLMWMITTAGPDQGGIGFEVHDYSKKILENVIQDDSYFTMIYTIDPGDDWTEEETWMKANPNWAISVMPENIAQLANRAIQVPSFQNSFRMKHLNEWTNASINWMDSNSWSRQASTIDEQDLAGADCIIALDLASKIDIAAKVKIYRVPNDYQVSSRHPWKYFVFPHLYLPEAAIKAGRNKNYQGWALGGHLRTMPGEVIDFEQIEEELQEDFAQGNVREVVYDPWQATQLAQRLIAKGVPVVEFPATVRNFTEPTKEFEALVRQGLIFHPNNPCFNWQISNLTVKEDRKGNIFPRKERDENKIDGPVAAIMGLARWMFEEHKQSFDVDAVVG